MKVFESKTSTAPVWRQRQRPLLTPNPQASLREQLHEVMRFFHYSERREETYRQWIERFLRFHRRPQGPAAANGAGAVRSWRHLREMGAEEVRAFFTHLATALQVAVSTQNQASDLLSRGNEVGRFPPDHALPHPSPLPLGEGARPALAGRPGASGWRSRSTRSSLSRRERAGLRGNSPPSYREPERSRQAAWDSVRFHAPPTAQEV